MLTGIKENAKFQKKKNGQNNEQSEQTSGLKHLVDGVKQHHNVKYGPSSLNLSIILLHSAFSFLYSRSIV
jgi:hypothetical protein